ncbi:MAG: UPF0175 family protein [Caldilineaceae bacterium]|nr:UPF0175 family protein [Caldilineaceae bacterium]
MNTFVVEMEFPTDFLSIPNVSKPELETRLRELFVIELFRDGRISSGKGAQLLGIPLWNFLQLLSKHRIDYFSQTPEELDAELAALDILHNTTGR